METETYKNAKLILERFDPEAKKKAVSAIFFALYIVCIDLSFIFVFDFWRFCLLLWCRSLSQLLHIFR